MAPRKTWSVSSASTSGNSGRVSSPPPVKQRSARSNIGPRCSVRRIGTDGLIMGFKLHGRRKNWNVVLRARKAEAKRAGNNGAEIRWEGDEMFFKNNDFPKWIPAAYHEDYREQFLAEDSQLGEFDEEAAAGGLPTDRTSFVPGQARWGGSRERWQYILDHEGRAIFDHPCILNNAPGLTARYDWWIQDGQILLDSQDRPMRWIPGLNRTLSTQVEGWRLDALRKLLPTCTWQDILGRILPSHTRYGKEVVIGETAYSNRALRFRQKNGVKDWFLRGGRARSRGLVLKPTKEAPTAISESTPALKNQSKKAQRKKERQAPVREVPFDASSLVHRVFPPESNVHRPDKPAPDMPSTDYVSMREASFVDPQDLMSYEEALYTFSASRESQTIGIPIEEVRLVPLFASEYDQHQALLQGAHLATPQAVADEIRSGSGLAHGIHLVMRHADTVEFLDNPQVADLTADEHEIIQRMAEAGQDFNFVDEICFLEAQQQPPQT